MDNNYIVEGIEQAATARDMVSKNWSDTWKNYAVQYALNRQANDDQLRLWELMNEYNSPAEQMKRFTEAGLNPNLVYSQGSSGNASSAAGYNAMQADIHPQKDRALQIQQASEVVGMISNMAQNISSLIDQGLDVQLKRNELIQSNFDTAVLKHAFPVNPGDTPDISYHNLLGDQGLLNPLSSKFDPLAFLAFQKQGNLPVFWNNFLTGESARELQGFKSKYQEYYNKNLLPKFNDYQQGKIDLQDIEKEIEGYNRDVMLMLPAELRGILGPLVQYLSPFMKFIFKRSSFHVR